jgi:hypothetical protein
MQAGRLGHAGLHRLPHHRDGRQFAATAGMKVEQQRERQWHRIRHPDH